MNELKAAFCPYCYNGSIVYLKKHKVFICNRCFKQVEMKESM